MLAMRQSASQHFNSHTKYYTYIAFKIYYINSGAYLHKTKIPIRLHLPVTWMCVGLHMIFVIYCCLLLPFFFRSFFWFVWNSDEFRYLPIWFWQLFWFHDKKKVFFFPNIFGQNSLENSIGTDTNTCDYYYSVVDAPNGWSTKRAKIINF